MNASRSGAHANRPVHFALTGAKGIFARTLLAQARFIPDLIPTLLCDLDLDGLRAMCVELGYDSATMLDCRSESDVKAVPSGSIALTNDISLLAHAAPCDILVEATGSPTAGFRAARGMIEAGRHVGMVSKEVDSVAGVALSKLAAKHGVVYTPVCGDQPANLNQLVSWARLLGLEIIAAGKAGEYDLVFDPASGVLTHRSERRVVGEMTHHLELGLDVGLTLAARRGLLKGLATSAAADYCEMAVVAANTGLVTDCELMHYPVARVGELADIYSLRSDGGILSRSGVLDVFNLLRLRGEASIAGGVFLVVRAHDAPTWAMLSEKGHVVSRNGRHACIYLPYHLMGVEAPVSLLNAVRHGWSAGSARPEQHAVLAGRAREGIAGGALLQMGGHHHDVTGVQPVLLARRACPPNVAPLYLAAHSRLKHDVPAGHLLTMDDLDDWDRELHSAWLEGLRDWPTGQISG